MTSNIEKLDGRVLQLVLDGRYRIDKYAESDPLSHLYTGVDVETDSMIGIRITDTPEGHRLLQEWLAKAVLSRGKPAILAVGHIDKETSYVVLSEAGLDILRPRPEDIEEVTNAIKATDAEPQPASVVIGNFFSSLFRTGKNDKDN